MIGGPILEAESFDGSFGVNECERTWSIGTLVPDGGVPREGLSDTGEDGAEERSAEELAAVKVGNGCCCVGWGAVGELLGLPIRYCCILSWKLVDKGVEGAETLNLPSSSAERDHGLCERPRKSPRSVEPFLLGEGEEVVGPSNPACARARERSNTDLRYRAQWVSQ